MANGSLTPSTITTFVAVLVWVEKRHAAALDLDCAKRRDDLMNVDIMQVCSDYFEEEFLWSSLFKENVRAFHFDGIGVKLTATTQ